MRVKQTLAFQDADTTSRAILNELEITSYDRVITLSYADTLDPQAADARTLISLPTSAIFWSAPGVVFRSSARCSTCATASLRRLRRPTTSSSATNW
jgi:hypothetical protein